MCYSSLTQWTKDLNNSLFAHPDFSTWINQCVASKIDIALIPKTLRRMFLKSLYPRFLCPHASHYIHPVVWPQMLNYDTLPTNIEEEYSKSSIGEHYVEYLKYVGRRKYGKLIDRYQLDQAINRSQQKSDKRRRKLSNLIAAREFARFLEKRK